MSSKVPALPRAYVWRRVHSLLGLWIVLFLTEHLFTNSQAALFFGDNGEGFVKAVNFIKGLPYLQVVEITLIGVPILVHGALGIKYLFTAKMNSFRNEGAKPSLPKYGRNQAYSLQRISSWILLIGIILHVGYMRFYKYPIIVDEGTHSSYIVRISMDKGLYTVADRLGVKLYDAQMVAREKERVNAISPVATPSFHGDAYQPEVENRLEQIQSDTFQKRWVEGLERKPLCTDQVLAVASNFGTATLLTVRDSFKHPFTCVLYTLFVLSAVYHGFNGLWTFFISWGVVIKMRSQKRAVNVCLAIMALIGFLGLASVWGTYWINLKS